MTDTIQNYVEYSYHNSQSGHHHNYLLPPLLEILSKNYTSNGKDLRILDLGCGNGSLSSVIAEKGYNVVGIDSSEKGIAIASQNFSNCEFIQGSIYDIPSHLFNSFDVVVSCDVIEHLFYPRELIKAAKKCLKEDGILIITTPYHGYLKNIVLAASGKMDQHLNPLWDGGHIKFFSVATLTRLLETEGCSDIKFKFAGRFAYVWKDMLCYCKPNKIEG